MFIIILFLGILHRSQSPTPSAPLEPCRVAPYVNLNTIRTIGPGTIPINNTRRKSDSFSCNEQNILLSKHLTNSVAPFSAFDPSILSAAAHQVRIFKHQEIIILFN